LTVLLNNEKIIQMLSEKEFLKNMIEYKRKEEHLRTGSELADMPINKFSYLDTSMINESLIKEFA